MGQQLSPPPTLMPQTACHACGRARTAPCEHHKGPAARAGTWRGTRLQRSALPRCGGRLEGAGQQWRSWWMGRFLLLSTACPAQEQCTTWIRPAMPMSLLTYEGGQAHWRADHNVQWDRLRPRAKPQAEDATAIGKGQCEAEVLQFKGRQLAISFIGLCHVALLASPPVSWPSAGGPASCRASQARGGTAHSPLPWTGIGYKRQVHGGFPTDRHN